MSRLVHLLNHVTSFGGRASKLLTRILRYITTGGLVVFTDFFFLWFLTSILGIHYLISGTISFTISTTLGYILHRRWTFKGTKRKLLHGYAYFYTTGVIGIIVTVSLLAVFVETFHFNYLIAKIFSGIIAGSLSLLMSFLITFNDHRNCE